MKFKIIKAWTKLVCGDFYFNELYETEKDAIDSLTWGDEKIVPIEIKIKN
jgi:hypothetical protein